MAGVIAGSDFPLSNHKVLQSICDEMNIPARIMMWSDGAASHPWPLSGPDDPEDIQSYWNRRNLESLNRKKFMSEN